jgi:predicted RND superfamily exporter protein
VLETLEREALPTTALAFAAVAALVVVTFGIGVEYPINVLARRRARPGPAPRATIVSASADLAVGLCSLTTIIGYGSLLLAENNALRSFGVLAVLGELCCITVALVALPAALALDAA